MGNDELADETRRGGAIINTDECGGEKSPKSPPVAPHLLDENRNKKHLSPAQPIELGSTGKQTRFSFDRTELTHTSSSPPIASPRRAARKSTSSNNGAVDSGNCTPTTKRAPWLTRKSADWGGGGAKSNGSNGNGTSAASSAAAGHRRTEVMVVLMGSSRVGKSAIVNQFLHNVFRHEYAATVDELHWIEYDTNTHQDNDNSTTPNAATAAANATNASANILLLKIMDTSGSHEFIGMRKLYEQQGDAFILVISSDDSSSFDEAKIIRQEIAERNTKRAPVICVLNKIDSRKGFDDDSKVDDETRRLATQVHEFAASTNCLFVEVTATEHDSVAEIFRRLLQQNSIVPSASQLKYRRKSVPITISEFVGSATDNGNTNGGGGGTTMMKKSITNGMNKKCLKAINENGTIDDEKRPACVIS